MTATTAVLEPHRIAYRPEVVEIILQTTRPQIQQAAHDIADMQTKVNGLLALIADKERFIAELRQAERHIEESAELPQLVMPPAGQGDAQQHAEWFGGPQTGVILPKGSFAETEPDGFCIHCGKPAWRVSTSTASPKGARHSYGATCNPDDPASNVAELEVQA